jgi:hypothetical protein
MSELPTGTVTWVDFTSQTWGIVGVHGERAVQVAVPASKTDRSAHRRCR